MEKNNNEKSKQPPSRMVWISITLNVVFVLTAWGIATDRVTGTVFEITAEELANADKYEVADYQRVAAPLASGRTAWVYVDARG